MYQDAHPPFCFLFSSPSMNVSTLNHTYLMSAFRTISPPSLQCFPTTSPKAAATNVVDGLRVGLGPTPALERASSVQLQVAAQKNSFVALRFVQWIQGEVFSMRVRPCQCSCFLPISNLFVAAGWDMRVSPAASPPHLRPSPTPAAARQDQPEPAAHPASSAPTPTVSVPIRGLLRSTALPTQPQRSVDTNTKTRQTKTGISRSRR